MTPSSLSFWQVLGIVSAVALPFFNIPLIIRIVRRRSAGDISLVWVVGVWTCALGLLPSSLRSPDPVLAVFGTVNIVLFSGVLGVVFYFRNGPRKSTPPQESSSSTRPS